MFIISLFSEDGLKCYNLVLTNTLLWSYYRNKQSGCLLLYFEELM